MKKLFTLLSLTVAMTSFGFALAPTASAATFTCGGTTVDTSIDFSAYTKRYCGSQDSTAVTALLLIVIDFMSVGVGIAVVAGIAWGGFVYTQAGGDSGKTKEAISIITNAIIGLVLFVGLYALANFFIPGGLFN